MQKSRLPIVISNWYIQGSELHWWRRGENKPGTAGTTKGRDHNGLSGYFTGHHVTISAWNRQDKDRWLITGSDGKRYLAQFSAHYNNRAYHTQCARSAADVEKKLSNIVVSD